MKNKLRHNFETVKLKTAIYCKSSTYPNKDACKNGTNYKNENQNFFKATSAIIYHETTQSYAKLRLPECSENMDIAAQRK